MTNPMTKKVSSPTTNKVSSTMTPGKTTRANGSVIKSSKASTQSPTTSNISKPLTSTTKPSEGIVAQRTGKIEDHAMVLI